MIDGAQGTRNTALALNTSYASFTTKPQSTPLGLRYVVLGHTHAGGRREVALLKDEISAQLVATHLGAALSSLQVAAEFVTRDREGR
jgi:hypothetical protein